VLNSFNLVKLILECLVGINSLVLYSGIVQAFAINIIKLKQNCFWRNLYIILNAIKIEHWALIKNNCTVTLNLFIICKKEIYRESYIQFPNLLEIFQIVSKLFIEIPVYSY